MSWAEELKNLGNEIVNELEQRLNELGELEEQIAVLLTEYKNQRERMYASLREMLSADRLQRVKEVNELLESYNTVAEKDAGEWLKRNQLASIENDNGYVVDLQ